MEFHEVLQSSCTLMQSYKRTPNIFYPSSKSKNQLIYLFYFISTCEWPEMLYLNKVMFLCSVLFYKPRLCRLSKWYLISKRRISFQNDVYVLHGRGPSKGTIISKFTHLFYNIKRSVETLSVKKYIFLFEDVTDCHDSRRLRIKTF